MQLLKISLILIFLVLSGCTTVERFAHMYSADAPVPRSYQYKDGGSSVFYSFPIGDSLHPETVVFFYGGSGCASWKSVMPGYVKGLTLDARVFVLNKRLVSDRSTGMFSCSQEFHRTNNPNQWIADYSEFISAQINASQPRPRNVVLVGVSEGGWVAAKVASILPSVSHLAIIGYGGWSMRNSLKILASKGAIQFDVDTGWKAISTDPASLEKQWFGNPYRWWSDVMDIDPLADYIKLSIPIFMGFGEKDESVPVESALFLESKFKEAGKSNFMLKVYPGADHRLSGSGISYRDAFFSEVSGHVR